nr:unnamed protein product [Haemonchus contortus]
MVHFFISGFAQLSNLRRTTNMILSRRCTLLVILLSVVISCLSQLPQTSGTQLNAELLPIVSKISGNHPRYNDPSARQLLAIWNKALQRAEMMEEMSSKRKSHKCLNSACTFLAFAERPRFWRTLRAG